MASITAEVAGAAGAEVRLPKPPETAPAEVVAGVDAWQAQIERTADVPAATAADMEWADACLFPAPTRFGVMASQMRAFSDTLGGVWARGGLANKAVSAMISAQNTHGAQETTVVSFHTTVVHRGGIVVAPPAMPTRPSPRPPATPMAAATSKARNSTTRPRPPSAIRCAG